MTARALPRGNHNALVKELLGDYIYDASLLNASICVEIDAERAGLLGLYDTKSDKLRFNEDGATNIYDRSYDHRRNDTPLSATTLPRTASTLCSWCRRS